MPASFNFNTVKKSFIDTFNKVFKNSEEGVTPEAIDISRLGFNRATPSKRTRRQNRQNHSQGKNKVRRKMAQASNRINRKHFKHWKH